MSDDFTSVGFGTVSDDQYSQLAGKLRTDYQNSYMGYYGSARYLLYQDPSGAQLWSIVTVEGPQVTTHQLEPHYNAAGEFLLNQIVAIGGLPYGLGWVEGVESGSQSGRKLLMQVPNLGMAIEAITRRSGGPNKTDNNIPARAQLLILSSADAIHDHIYRTKYGQQDLAVSYEILPVSGVNENEVLSNPIVCFHGRVLYVEEKKNSLTGNAFFAAQIEVAGGVVTIATASAHMRGTPKIGSYLAGFGLLKARFSELENRESIPEKEHGLIQGHKIELDSDSAKAPPEFARFTEDERALLTLAPLFVFFLVSSADGTIDEKEIEAFVSSLDPNLFSASPILAAGIQRFVPHPTITNPIFEGRIDVWKELNKLTQVVRDKFTKDEAIGFKRVLLDFAHHIASASGSGLGALIGNNIDKSEREVLNRLEQLL